MTQTSPRVSWGKAHIAFGFAARLYLSWIFVSASWHKLVDPASFALDVATYQLLPHSLVNAFAIVVPWIELAAGLLLAIGYRVRAAALIVVLLMLSFLIALFWALHLGLDMSCGCFASQAATGEDAISWRRVVRELSWLSLGVIVFAVDREALGVDRIFRKG